VRTFSQHVRADFAKNGHGLLNIAWWPLFVHRLGAWALSLPYPARYAVSGLYVLLHFAVHLISSTTIAREAQIGADLFLPHSGNIIIHPDCVIGDACAIFHEVTIGTSIDKIGVPRIGHGVMIGPGAKLLGPITIGDGARIAANSLVISNVPAGAVAIGVPARIIAAPPASYQRTAPAVVRIVD
jgi:serine O-acetyltransferase